MNHHADSQSPLVEALELRQMLAAAPLAPPVEPIIIGHRGASGHRPEHTLASYELAIRQGADYIEPDLVTTKDGVLIARHEPVLAQVRTDAAGNPLKNPDGSYQIVERTTNVDELPQFANRLTTKLLDGVRVTGWFAEDFTLKEIKKLRAVERLPFRNHAFDGQFKIPTFQEVVDLTQKWSKKTGRTIGIYPETKHPTYFDQQGLSLEEPLVRILRAEDLDDSNDPVFIQSFEVSNLKELNTLVDTPIVQLINAGGQPYDFTVAGSPTTYAQMATPAGLAQIATYADGIGANKRLIVPLAADGHLAPPTTLIDDAHDAGLLVHAWTFRNESPQFLHPDYAGDPAKEYEQFFDLGLDGLFSDFPDAAVAARDTWLA
jgi:glycerophosphoryl diester phosphodiesterase